MIVTIIIIITIITITIIIIIIIIIIINFIIIIIIIIIITITILLSSLLLFRCILSTFTFHMRVLLFKYGHQKFLSILTQRKDLERKGK